MSTSTLQETTPSNAAGDLGRRAFLARAGNTALAVPITTSLIVSASATPAIAGSPYGGEGGGHGPKHKPHPKGKKVKHGGGPRKGRYLTPERRHPRGASGPPPRHAKWPIRPDRKGKEGSP